MIKPERVVSELLEVYGDEEWHYANGRKWGEKDRLSGTDRDLEHYPPAFAKGYRSAQGTGGIGRRAKDWISGAWQGAKNAVGIGQDSFGMGTNTEQGWKPKYTGNVAPSAPAPSKAPRRSPETGKTWNIG